MKVISPKQMSLIESQAYRNGASESDFMEEAGSGVALVVQDYVERHYLDRKVILLCGKGNNAGDAYVAGTHLLHLEYEVFAIQVAPLEECSPLCKSNYQRFMNDGGRSAENLSEFPQHGIIIDGLFGTGFHGKLTEPYNELVQLANDSKLPIIAVDIPSGLNGETGEVDGVAIIATETAFLGLPKTGFFLNDGWNHVGKLRYIDFGLGHEYIDSSSEDFIMLTEELIAPLLPPIPRSRHKYQAGFVVGLAGSPGMPGAAMLSSTAALRSGAGIVKLLHPEGMQSELAASPYELIRVVYHENDIHLIVDLMNRASATFVGPGLGLTDSKRQLLRELLPLLQKPCVLDADALTIISEEEIPLPKDTIFTPHHGEMARLLGIPSAPRHVTPDFLKTCQAYAESREVTLILKGAPTFIFHPNSSILVNPTGDPGMATAGSGDVLTGLLASLLSQGMPPLHAAPTAVFLHGLAGEHAADEMTPRGMLASDIINRFPEAFKFLML